MNFRFSETVIFCPFLCSQMASIDLKPWKSPKSRKSLLSWWAPKVYKVLNFLLRLGLDGKMKIQIFQNFIDFWCTFPFLILGTVIFLPFLFTQMAFIDLKRWIWKNRANRSRVGGEPRSVRFKKKPNRLGQAPNGVHSSSPVATRSVGSLCGVAGAGRGRAQGHQFARHARIWPPRPPWPSEARVRGHRRMLSTRAGWLRTAKDDEKKKLAAPKLYRAALT